MQRYTIVASNVPGPVAPVYVCGQKVLGLQVFYPNLITQMICVSYNNKMHINFCVDPDVVVGHKTLPTLYIDELRALALHYGVDPDDTSAPTPTTDQPAAAVAVAVAASASGGKLGSRGSGLAMV